MSMTWLKRYLPRGLYARAALILLVPVLLLLAIVSVLFIQRQLEDVTNQMTATVTRDLRLIEATLAASDTRESALAEVSDAADFLQMQVRFVAEDAVPAEEFRLFYDYSGLVLTRALHDAMPAVLSVQLPAEPQVVIYLQTPLGPVEIVANRRWFSPAVPHQLPLTMIVAGLVLVLVAFLYLRNQLRPITRLAAAAQAFGRGRVVPYTPTGAIEVRAAGNAFLDMRARIERHIEQRTLMLSGVSHDLRTPLTRLKLELAMLEPEQAAPMLADLDEMEHMLDEFLSFAKGSAESEMEETDPLALVTRVVEDAERAGAPVRLVSAVGSGRIQLRAGALRRAVENLTGNAVRYGSQAEVSVRLTDKTLRIRVEDDGPGIAPDQRAQALKPFARLDPARNQNKGGGVGLGLAIAADIARAHGGVLRLGESEHLGGLRADIVIGR